MSAEETIRVLIVDDHDVVRRGLQSIFDGSEGIDAVGAAASGEEALMLARGVAPDVVLLDLQLPGMHGLDVIPQLLSDSSSPPAVVVLTVHDDDELALRAVKAGAHGFVLKHASADELIRVIRHVAAGGKHFDEVVVRAFMNSEEQARERTLLTDHEVEIVRLVAAGATNREIAQSLILSPDTVKSHLENIYRKLGVADRAHAVAVAMRKGLLQ